jgi:tRNA A-37 threonylcarbamoyl transferase component Bud32
MLVGDDMQRLGKYCILEELGRGAFATVYRALDTTLDRKVALKVLHPQLLTDPTFAERIKREARAMADLRHPHIVTVYEISEAEGRLFIAMELARGPNLGQVITERGCISWEEAQAILKSVCQALDYAHRQGIVHRDLKPSNILLDAERGPMLTDFGFARLMADSSVSLSLSGGILGTPAYIAPEVWELDAAEPPADVYALACIAYEMLTGEVLFAGKTPMQVMRAHDQGAQFPQDWPEDVPEGIEAVLGKALARDPEARYPSGSALWYALNDLEEKAQAVRESAELEALAAQWRAETEEAIAAKEWGAAKMAVGRWLAAAPDDPAAQKAQAEIEQELEKSRQSIQLTGLSRGKRPIPRWVWIVVGALCLSVIACLASRGVWQGWLQAAMERGPSGVELKASPQVETPVLLPTLTSIPGPVSTETLVPTDTPIPTNTLLPTDTPMPIPTDMPTPEPTDTPMPTAAHLPPTVTSTPEGTLANPVASTQSLLPCWGRTSTSISPGIGHTVFGQNPITFSWGKDFDLPHGYYFEVILIHESGEPVLVQTSDSYQTTFSTLPLEKHGGWNWYIYVKTSTGKYATCDGKAYLFDGGLYERSSSGCPDFTIPEGDGCRVGGFRYSFWYQPHQ